MRVWNRQHSNLKLGLDKIFFDSSGIYSNFSECIGHMKNFSCYELFLKYFLLNEISFNSE